MRMVACVRATLRMTSRSWSMAGHVPSNVASVTGTAPGGRRFSVVMAVRSGVGVAAIEFRHEMGPLPAGRGKLIGGDESEAQAGLFVFAVQHEDSHDEIL